MVGWYQKINKNILITDVHDLNQEIFFCLKLSDLNHRDLSTLNPLSAKKYLTQAQHMYCLKLFLYRIHLFTHRVFS